MLCVQLERFAEDEARAVGFELDKDLKSFGKGFTVIEQVSVPTLGAHYSTLAGATALLF